MWKESYIDFTTNITEKYCVKTGNGGGVRGNSCKIPAAIVGKKVKLAEHVWLRVKSSNRIIVEVQGKKRKLLCKKRKRNFPIYIFKSVAILCTLSRRAREIFCVAVFDMYYGFRSKHRSLHKIYMCLKITQHVHSKNHYQISQYNREYKQVGINCMRSSISISI